MIVYIFLFFTLSGTGLKDLHVIAHLILTNYDFEISCCLHFTDEEIEIQGSAQGHNY